MFDMEIWTGFILGLLGGFHCIGMCGPIAMSIPVDRSSVVKKWLSFFLYNAGRALTYSALGIIFGLVGRVFKVNGLQQWLSILLGAFIIVAVVVPTFVSIKNPASNFIIPYVGKLKEWLGSYLRKKSLSSVTILGLLNGLLPCGMVYIGLTVATTSGSGISGGLYMLAFGLGTFPLMIGVQWIGSFLKAKNRGKIRRLVPVFVFLVGAMMILRGLNLGIPYLSPQLEVKEGHVKACH